MLAGTLYRPGVYIGDDVMPPTEGNPRGYFESFDIQNLNEDILKQVLPKRPANAIGDLFFRKRPGNAQRWLAFLPPGSHIPSSPPIERAIESKVSREPFVLKDPRFCYTLPLWRRRAKNAVNLCVFRHPHRTARSILREAETERYLKNLSISFGGALRVWRCMYTHVLETHRRQGDWLFLHYDQLFEEETLDRIERFIDGPVNRSFPDRSVSRTRRDSIDALDAGSPEAGIYRALCALAGYEEESEGRAFPAVEPF
jgi:hypothetical protein